MAKFKWTVEFEVDEVWVADGFSLSNLRALEMLASDLDYADMTTELSAKVIKAPPLDRILKAQGYDIAGKSMEEKLHMLGDNYDTKATKE
jgi:hypothetical protein